MDLDFLLFLNGVNCPGSVGANVAILVMGFDDFTGKLSGKDLNH
jgi:hypothetical protein